MDFKFEVVDRNLYNYWWMQKMKEVVNHATKLNEAIFGMKGVPVVRAQISFGGHYDGL